MGVDSFSPICLFSNGDSIPEENRSALSELKPQADEWLTEPEVISVVSKNRAGPCGDSHDYVSMAPYWWPDPAKPDGLPYVWRDGEVNPDFYNYDSTKLEVDDSKSTTVGVFLS